ncbi:hypothetical protein [Rubinisphaera italica]|uniref:Uncharacterized protein n=1 Tax=Rubinisphaera italica TaxID=2527969 RepID=A0A5C5XAB1_9PLAN|nr:hypothetical protein [Rubinisphaera italica]TWT59734.1 hypothetical protein Pan54_04440 [Rubinisphaera italica]
MKAGFDLGITDAQHQQTTKLAEVQQQFQQVKYGIEGYSQSAYDYAGLTVETYEDEYGNPITYEPNRDTVYRNSVKQAWRDSDQTQSTARLNYVTNLSGIHQTAEADLAEVNRIYQQALADANRTASDTRALVRSTFNKLEADTYAQETAAWTTSAPTPWHKQAAQNAEAQADYIEIEQTQLLAKKQAENAAERDYAVERESAWKTLRTDRSAQQASEAITQQQLLENGDYEYEPGDYDPYENVTVDLPTGVNYSDTGDPTKFENDLDDGNFNGNLNLGNTFGSGIGNANYEGGSSEDAFSPYDLASQQAGQKRGQSFNANNPLGNLGTSSAQINGVQNVNWTGNLSNQQTNQQDGSQIGSVDFGAAQQWQRSAVAGGGSNAGTAAVTGSSNGEPDLVKIYELYDSNGNFLGIREDRHYSIDPFGQPSRTESTYYLSNGDEVAPIDFDQEKLVDTQDNTIPNAPTRPNIPENQPENNIPISDPRNSNGLTNEEQYALQLELQDNYLAQTSIQNKLEELYDELEGAQNSWTGWGHRDVSEIQSEIDYYEESLAEKQRQEESLRNQLENPGNFDWQGGDYVGEMSLEDKFYNALGIAIDEGYIEDELGTQGSGIFSAEFIQGFAQELIRDILLRAAGSATGVGGVVTIGLSIKDAAEIFAEVLEAYYEIRDAYTEEMLDEAAKVLAEKIASVLIEKAMDKAIDGGSRLGSRLGENLPTTTIAKPITVGESTANVDTSTNTANNVPEANGNGGEIPGDAQANGNGNANGGFQAGQNQGGNGGNPNNPFLPTGNQSNHNDYDDYDTLNMGSGGELDGPNVLHNNIEPDDLDGSNLTGGTNYDDATDLSNIPDGHFSTVMFHRIPGDSNLARSVIQNGFDKLKSGGKGQFSSASLRNRWIQF